MLSDTEREVRDTLIRVCRREVQTVHDRKIGYKELWRTVYPEGRWGRHYVREVVDWIVPISNYDVAHSRPPLNSLVVWVRTGLPGAKWDAWNEEAEQDIDNYHRYQTAEAAQQACWDCEHWPEPNVPGGD